MNEQFDEPHFIARAIIAAERYVKLKENSDSHPDMLENFYQKMKSSIEDWRARHDKEEDAEGKQ